MSNARCAVTSVTKVTLQMRAIEGGGLTLLNDEIRDGLAVGVTTPFIGDGEILPSRPDVVGLLLAAVALPVTELGLIAP